MKKAVLLLTICLFAVTKGFSQDKGYVAVSIGPSFPIGDFASKDPDNEKAGLAQTGAIFDISFGYKLGKNFGVAALIRGQANSTDTQAIVDELYTQIPSTVNADVETGNWTAGAFLAGGYASFPVSKKISFDPRVMIGFLSATSPDTDVYLSDGSNSGWVKQASVTSTAFAYLVGVGLKFDVGKRICILTNLDYMGANPEFKDVQTLSSDGNIEVNNWKQPFSTINVGVGVGYRL